MCGFVSIINSHFKEDRIKNIITGLSKINTHRGPDEIKTIYKNSYSILFRRLKIIDLSQKGSQPYMSDDGKIILVFNGEIYNYLELRKELEEKKIRFKSQSDTEVLMRSYETWGLDFINKIRGMFSIIFFDEKRKKIYCFRDHLGQKPFYYSKFSGGIILSSEIKDILYIKDSKDISENNNTVFKYLLRGWCDDTNETFYNDIFSLPAGSFGIVENSEIKIKRYWKLDISKNNQYNPEEFKSNYDDNLKLHLRADVPIAFTLSGGLDSSSLVKSALNSGMNNYKSFSLQTNSNDDNYEKSIIDNFISENSLNHSFIKVNDFYNDNILENLISFQDEPMGDVSFVNQFLLRKKIHEDGYKVLIIGEGGDELLAGYNRMFIPFLYNVYLKNNKNIPEKIKNNIALNLGNKFSLIEKKLHNYSNILTKNNDIEDLEVFNFLEVKEHQIPSNLKFYNNTNPNKENSFKKFLCSHLFKRDLPHILRLEDRISMSQSIENRTPFVDYKFMEYVFSIDEEFFMKDGLSKYMLRNMMSQNLPKNYFKKKKIGRPGDSKTVIFEFYYEKFCDYLLNHTNKNIYFDTDKILHNLSNDKKNKDYRFNNNIYFRILNYLIWKNQFENFNKGNTQLI